VIKKTKSPDFHTWFSGLKIFTSHVVYSRIWRNPLMYDRQFGYTKFVKRKLECRKLSDFFNGEASPKPKIKAILEVFSSQK